MVIFMAMLADFAAVFLSSASPALIKPKLSNSTDIK